MHYTLDQQSTIISLTVTRHIDHYLGRRYPTRSGRGHSDVCDGDVRDVVPKARSPL